MKNPSVHDGHRCRFTDEYANHHSKQEVRTARASCFGTVQGKSERGDFLVLWDGDTDSVSCSPGILEIGPLPVVFKTVADAEEAFGIAALNAGLRRNTRGTYVGTIREFCRLMKDRKISGPQEFFGYLASKKRLSGNSVCHALNPLKFFYERVLWKEFGQYELPRRNRNKPMRAVLSMQQVLSMMERMERKPRLQTGLLAGTGMRIESDMLTLRLKDVRIDERVITIFDGKGGKGRALEIPEFILPELEMQISGCVKLWERDRAKGMIYPLDDESLMRKLGNRTMGSLPWMWLFPSQKVHGNLRWHATDKVLVSALNEAADALQITQRVHPHALRRTYATTLLREGVDVRVIQHQLGHTSLETTELYLDPAGMRTVKNPIDRVAERNVIPIRRTA